jgi:hypothetical protein
MMHYRKRVYLILHFIVALPNFIFTELKLISFSQRPTLRIREALFKAALYKNLTIKKSIGLSNMPKVLPL